MKQQVLLVFFLLFSIVGFNQRGFYKNLYNNYGDHLIAPNIHRIDALSNRSFFITSAVNYSNDYFTCTKLDNDFNLLWEKSYLKGTDSPTNLMEYGRELTDGHIASIGIYGPFVVIIHDTDGNLVSSNRYGTPDQNYAIGTIQTSSLPDSTAVFIVGQCAIKYGLIKIDKNGDIIWAYEYYNGNTRARIYVLEHGADFGYVTCGNNAEIGDGTFLNSGVVTLSNDDGTFRKASIFRSIIPDRNSVLFTQIRPSSVENAYYTSVITNYNVDFPLIYDNYNLLLKLDSNLSITKQWKLKTTDDNQRVRISNMVETADGNLIVNGDFRDTVTHALYSFIAKIDPSADGSIVWAKKVVGIAAPSDNTLTNQGLELFGPYEDIVFSFHATFDGATIASIDQNGEGFCQATDLPMVLEQTNKVYAESFELAPITPDITPYAVPLTEYNITHTDTLLCYTSDLSIPKNKTNSKLITWYTTPTNYTIIQNETGQLVSITLFNLQGQLVTTINLAPYESKEIVKNTTLLLFRAQQGEKLQFGKI